MSMMLNKPNSEMTLEKQKETFVASISHDLKNPTIAQIRALELFLNGQFGTLKPDQREIIQMILDSCKYMNAMLSSLLITYKNEKGIIKLCDEEISIAEIAKECIEEMVYLAKGKDIKIVFVNFAYNDTIYGDSIQIKRVIMNLISNGIKYAYNNTNLKIKIYNENLYTCFEFENKSPYIKSEKIQQLFSKYVSFAKSQNITGTGLGLYTSKKIVEAHGGEIFVKSFKDNRNVFGFKIPYTKPIKNTPRTVVF